MDANKARKKARSVFNKELYDVWDYIDHESGKCNYYCTIKRDLVTNSDLQKLKDKKYGYRHVLGSDVLLVCWLHNNRKDNMNAIKGILNTWR